MRLARPLAWLLLAPLGLAPLGMACGPAASYPDAPAIAAAQSAWCDALAKLNGGTKWDHLADCKLATPTAEPAYLAGFTKCFVKRREELGDKSYDQGQIAAECRDETLYKLKVDDAAAREAIDGRCRRALRCEKTETSVCKSSLANLPAGQRAVLYGIYNAQARHQLAECLDASSCETGEDAANAACYKPLEEKLIWFP